MVELIYNYCHVAVAHGLKVITKRYELLEAVIGQQEGWLGL